MEGNRRALGRPLGRFVCASAVIVTVAFGCTGGGSPSPAAAASPATLGPNPTLSGSPPTALAPLSAAPTAPTAAARLSGRSPVVGGERPPGEPDPALTPGATNPSVTQATIGSTICVSGWAATVRPPSSYTTSLKGTQITEYGYADTNLADYEEDHLVPLELGGAPKDPANLWPEPYAVTLADGTPVGARVKDQLENRLRSLVCAGSMTLARAQQLIRTDWIAAWRTYVGRASTTATGRPATPAPTGPKPTPEPVARSTGLRVTIVSLTSPVARGSTASLSASTVPGAACTITVTYKSGPSRAAGLVPKTASSTGRVSWSWTVGTRTTPGAWPATVVCASGGATASSTKSFVVQ